MMVLGTVVTVCCVVTAVAEVTVAEVTAVVVNLAPVLVAMFTAVTLGGLPTFTVMPCMEFFAYARFHAAVQEITSEYFTPSIHMAVTVLVPRSCCGGRLQTISLVV
jgi:hypothetical protein